MADHSTSTTLHHPGRTPDTYASIILFISSVGILGGSITFAVLFQLDGHCNDEHVLKVLGFSTVLFLGSVLSCVPILVTLQTQRDTPLEHSTKTARVRDDHVIPGEARARLAGSTLIFVRSQTAIVALLMFGGFFCMFLSVLWLGHGAPAILGFVLLGLSVVWSFLGYLIGSSKDGLGLRSKVSIYIIQGFFLAFLVVINVVFGKTDVTGLTYPNKCTVPRAITT